MTENCSGEAAR
nr:TPA_asm: M25 uORF 2 RNA *1 [Murid betaherpesvirus 1]DBA07745.1 TPA_asm: M25 uORF 2 RNA *1 [Murid betaherpesvirus 1]